MPIDSEADCKIGFFIPLGSSTDPAQPYRRQATGTTMHPPFGLLLGERRFLFESH